MKWNNKYKNTVQTLSNLFVKWENQQIIGKKIIKRNKKLNKAKKNTASSPGQDLHPD